MLFTEYNADDEINDMKWLIDFHIKALLMNMTNRQEVLELLKDIILFEEQLIELRAKRNDCHN